MFQEGNFISVQGSPCLMIGMISELTQPNNLRSWRLGEGILQQLGSLCDSDCGGEGLAQQVRCCLGCSYPISECLGFSLSSAPNSSFCQCTRTLGEASDVSSCWALVTCVGDLNYIPSTWFPPGTALTFVGREPASWRALSVFPSPLPPERF